MSGDNKGKALLAGATGLVGGHCLRQLLENDYYESVTVLSRRDLDFSHEKMKVEIINFDTLDRYESLFQVEHVYSCLGTTIKTAGSQEAFKVVDYQYPLELARLAQGQGIGTYSIISSMGVDAQSRIFYSRVKGQLEQELIELNLPSLQIFRPSLLTGNRSEFRLGERLADYAMKPLNAVMIGPFRKYRSIAAELVAKAMVKQTVESEPGLHIYESDKIAELGKLR